MGIKVYFMLILFPSGNIHVPIFDDSFLMLIVECFNGSVPALKTDKASEDGDEHKNRLSDMVAQNKHKYRQAENQA